MVVILGPSAAAGPALASVGLPESHQPKLLKEGDEAMQDAVDPVHQPKVDADGLQGGEGEQADPKGHEPVCIIVITHQQGPNGKAEQDKMEKLIIFLYIQSS